MQDIRGPISGDIANALIRLGELVPFLPDHLIRDGRRAVQALADACLRVQGLENAAHIAPDTDGDGLPDREWTPRAPDTDDKTPRTAASAKDIPDTDTDGDLHEAFPQEATNV